VSARRILIVEDDAELRSALAAAMRAGGAHVETAVDGPHALAQLRAGPCPSVILLDLRLSCPNGQAFLDELRADARFHHLPVITMAPGASAADRAGDDGARPQHDPVDVDDLRRIVESLLEAGA
jgi:CheY-like chemotaxis protein